MSFVFSADDLEYIYTEMKSSLNEADRGKGYAAVIEAMTETVVSPHPNSAGGDPIEFKRKKANVDDAVYVLAKGAKKVNDGTGAFAKLIRDYTEEQYKLRTGDPGLSVEDLNKASNQIAENFIGSILFGLPPASGNTWKPLYNRSLYSSDRTYAEALSSFTNNTLGFSGFGSAGRLPTAYQVGLFDAGGAASQIFKDTATTNPTEGNDGNHSPWAGTVFFTQLGVGDFFRDWILKDDPLGGTDEYKKEEGAYDLSSAL